MFAWKVNTTCVFVDFQLIRYCINNMLVLNTLLKCNKQLREKGKKRNEVHFQLNPAAVATAVAFIKQKLKVYCGEKSTPHMKNIHQKYNGTKWMRLNYWKELNSSKTYVFPQWFPWYESLTFSNENQSPKFQKSKPNFLYTSKNYIVSVFVIWSNKSKRYNKLSLL